VHITKQFILERIFLVLSQSVMVNSKLSFLKSLLNVLHVLKIILEKNQSVFVIIQHTYNLLQFTS